MTYLALARKWRPKQFSEVVGQEHVVTALSNALNAKRVHHAYLFTGTRGVGKTTLARIFAKSLNCDKGVSAEPCQQCSVCVSVDAGNYVDLLEVDAASRTGIDDMRELLDNVQYAPTSGSYKVYLIDEVHMLSKSSFNALLKTLEEPPEHVKFLFATTDPQKLPVTVLSRCLQFSLLALQPIQIATQINKILDAESIAYESNAIDMISRAASGSMRDSLSLLEQAIAQGGNKVEESSVINMLGAVKAKYIDDLVDHLASNAALKMLECTDEMAAYAVDFTTALDQLLLELHHISLAQVVPQALTSKELDVEKYQGYAAQFSPEQVQLLYQIALIGKRDIVLAPDPRAGFEMVLMRMLAFTHDSKETLNSDQTTTQAPINTRVAAETASPKTTHVETNTLKPGTPTPEQGVAKTTTPETKAQPAVISLPKATPSVDLPPGNSLAAKAPEPIADIRDLSPGKIEPQVAASNSVPDIAVEPRIETRHDNTPSKNAVSHERLEPNLEQGSIDTNHFVAPIRKEARKEARKETREEVVRHVEDMPANMLTGTNQSHITADPLMDNKATTSTPTTNTNEPESDYQIAVEPASSSTWAGMVERLNLNGLIKEFAMNIACDDINANPMKLYFDPGYKFLHNLQREELVTSEIRKIRQGDYGIDFILEKSVAETPSERLRRKQVEKRNQTKDTLMQDEGMQGLMDNFDLSMNEQSIKPK